MNDRHTHYEHEVIHNDGEISRFEILDLSNPVLKSAQNEAAESEFQNHIKWGDVFMLLYSTVDRPSFNEITRLAFLVNLLHKSTCPEPTLTIIGTKIDLQQQKMVSELEGRQLAESIGARFYEVSASQCYEKVERIFRESADLYKFNLLQVRFPEYI